MNRGVFLIHVICLSWVGWEPRSPDLLKNLGWWSQSTSVVGHWARGKESSGKSRPGKLNGLCWNWHVLLLLTTQIYYTASLKPTETEVQSYYVPGKELEIIGEEHLWRPYFVIKTSLWRGENPYYHSDLNWKGQLHLKERLSVTWVEGKWGYFCQSEIPFHILRKWHKNHNSWHSFISQKDFLLFLWQTTNLFKPVCFSLLAYFFNQVFVNCFFLWNFIKAENCRVIRDTKNWLLGYLLLFTKIPQSLMV